MSSIASQEKRIKQFIWDAKNGDSSALESLVLEIQNDVFSLCLKSLFDPEQARDCCQEILIKVLTHLSSFEGKSKFSTWVYKISINHIKDLRRKKEFKLTFTEFEEDLFSGASEPPSEELNTFEAQYQLEEIRIGCTLALLQCLSEDERTAYILGEILMLTSNEGSKVMDISSASFRKKLERARNKVISFTKNLCGVQNSRNKCSCSKRLKAASFSGRLEFGFQKFITPNSHYKVLELIRSLQDDQKAAAHYRLYSPSAPVETTNYLINLVKKY